MQVNVNPLIAADSQGTGRASGTREGGTSQEWGRVGLLACIKL